MERAFGTGIEGTCDWVHNRKEVQRTASQRVLPTAMAHVAHRKGSCNGGAGVAWGTGRSPKYGEGRREMICNGGLVIPQCTCSIRVSGLMTISMHLSLALGDVDQWRTAYISTGGEHCTAAA